MSKLKDEVSLLSAIPMFTGLSPSKLKLLAFASDRMKFANGQNIVRQGDPSEAAYVIIDGVADVLISSRDGGENTVAQLGRNAMLGDMGILAEIPRTATVRARGDVEALRIRKEHLMEMVMDSPTLAMEVLKNMVDRLVKTTRDLADAKDEIKRISG